MATEQTDTQKSQFDDPWTNYLLSLGRAAHPGDEIQVPNELPSHYHMPPVPSNWPAHTNRFTSNDAMINALQGHGFGLGGLPPSNTDQLQHMAGDVVRPPLQMFNPGLNQWNVQDFYDRVLSPNASGTNSANPNAVLQAMTKDKLTVFPRSK